MRVLVLILIAIVSASASAKAAEPHRTGRSPAVIVGFVVRIDGTPDLSTLRIIESSGDPALDDKAWDEVNGYRFTPSTEDGEPVEYAHKLRIVFADPAPSNGMTMETAVIAAPPDKLVLTTDRPCAGMPVLTQAGPRTLGGFTVTGMPELIRRAKGVLFDAGVLESAIEASSNDDRLTVELDASHKPSRVIAAYHQIEDNAGYTDVTITPRLLPIDILIEAGCVGELIGVQPLPAPSASIPLNGF
ncbi:energy transducer TonB [Emcibacter sp. SYSU 3D8]|uniref:energy transducer TonB n=1 Tax=Emcibacter sp. SYSU 3D8 TaxID=3133969 RepID=UPI0031FE4940